MITEGAVKVMVFAMHIRRNGSAKSDETGTRRYERKEAARQKYVYHVGE